ncbi:MAG: hypothetical protein HWD58_04925 [Bacteroidota bacterium]|nr:MAG: hypothetical protein HWD58_04925 [Bacteroidota bacterium]
MLNQVKEWSVSVLTIVSYWKTYGIKDYVFHYWKLKSPNGKAEASFGEYLLQNLSKDLTAEFGKGFSKRNHEPIRKFYLTYRIAKSPISQSLTWTHYLSLMRIEIVEERAFMKLKL